MCKDSQEWKNITCYGNRKYTDMTKAHIVSIGIGAGKIHRHRYRYHCSFINIILYCNLSSQCFWNTFNHDLWFLPIVLFAITPLCRTFFGKYWMKSWLSLPGYLWHKSILDLVPEQVCSDLILTDLKNILLATVPGNVTTVSVSPWILEYRTLLEGTPYLPVVKSP